MTIVARRRREVCSWAYIERRQRRPHAPRDKLNEAILLIVLVKPLEQIDSDCRAGVRVCGVFDTFGQPQLLVADMNDVAADKNGGGLDALSVDERSVGAAEIGNLQGTVVVARISA